MASKVVRGADIILWINGEKYHAVNSVSWDIDHGENAICGIDDPWPQEIAATGKVVTTGSISGLKLRFDGNLQGSKIRAIIGSILSAPYISIRVQDRVTQEDLIYMTKAKVSNERWGVAAKGIIQMSFRFLAMKGFTPLDRVDSPRNQEV